MSDNDDFYRARQSKMRDLFNDISEARNPYSPLSEQGKLFRRVEDLRKQQTAHFERHAPNWRQKELNKLIEEHRGQLQPKLTPKYILDTETSPAALGQKAWNNVAERLQKRQTNLLEISDRMQLKASHRDQLAMKNTNGLKI